MCVKQPVNITTAKCNDCPKNCSLIVSYSPSLRMYIPTLNGEPVLFYEDTFHVVHPVQSYPRIQGAINAAHHMAQECARYHKTAGR